MLGVVTNLARLQAIVDHPAFRAGDLHTGFLEEHLQRRARAAPGPPTVALQAAAARRCSSAEPAGVARARAGPAPRSAGAACGAVRLRT